MEKVTPCQPTIGKVQLIFDDVFKLSRLLGTFPIDPGFTGISIHLLAKGVIVYVLATVCAVPLLYLLWEKETALANKIAFSTQMFLQTLFHFINLFSLAMNGSLLNEFYKELKDIEYRLWKNGIVWFYKADWFTKYFSFVISILYLISWDAFHYFFSYFRFNIVHYITIPGIYSVMSQYMSLLQICHTLLREIRLLEDTRSSIQLTEKVLDLCQKSNNLYEKQLLFYIIGIFFSYIFTLYTRLVHASIFETEAPWHIIRLFLLLHPLFLIIRYVRFIYDEVNKINKTLYRKLLFDLDDETLQFHLLAKRKIIFTACGFFDLGLKFIWSMFTTAVNYLVFLVQYT